MDKENRFYIEHHNKFLNKYSSFCWFLIESCGAVIFPLLVILVVQVVVYFYKLGADGIAILNELVNKVYGF